MPIYTYKCQTCGNEYDHFQHGIEPVDIACECGGSCTKQMPKRTGVIFHDSYLTQLQKGEEKAKEHGRNS